MQTELEIGTNPPRLRDLDFRQGSQNFRVYATLAFNYSSIHPDNSWVSTKLISKIVPGGVTRRINDIRVALQPERSLRGKVGWWVENRVRSVHDPVLDRKVKHSWYRLIYLVENLAIGLSTKDVILGMKRIREACLKMGERVTP